MCVVHLCFVKNSVNDDDSPCWVEVVLTRAVQYVKRKWTSNVATILYELSCFVSELSETRPIYEMVITVLLGKTV
jgi:hypothetical protein